MLPFSFASRGSKRVLKRISGLQKNRVTNRVTLETLEDRLVPANPGNIVSGQLYRDVAFYDFRGDTVNVSVTGPVTASSGFTLDLNGGAVNFSDIDNINLIGLTAKNSLIIQVTPNQLTIDSGGEFTKMWSSGYVNVGFITSAFDPERPGAPATTAMGGIQLSAAVVNSIDLPNVSIGNISLDTGKVIFVDRVNGQNPSAVNINVPVVTAGQGAVLTEVVDESANAAPAPYNPCAGLIDLGDIDAAGITTLTINGAISSETGNPFSPPSSSSNSTSGTPGDTTNDIEGVITVSGAIGSIVAPLGELRGSVTAGSIGSIQVGKLSGDITTTDSSQALKIALPSQFSGHIRSAGHLNLGFPNGTSGKGETGAIEAGGGISGINTKSATDPIYVPASYPGVVNNFSTSNGISDLVFEGTALSHWSSSSAIGNITANIFGAGFLAEAITSIGNIKATQTTLANDQGTVSAVLMEGHFQAGGSIGNINSAVQINANFLAGQNIGSITATTGGINSTVILAGGNIGAITAFQLEASDTQISAGGNIGNIRIYSGTWSARVKGANIGTITIDSGMLDNAVFVAGQSIGDITVTNKQGNAIEGGSIIAGKNIGNIAAYAFQGTGILGTLIQAGNHTGDQIASIKGISYSVAILPPITPPSPSNPGVNNGIDKVQILAASIGPILGQGYAGTGIFQSVIHSQMGDIASITGIGNIDGIYHCTVVAEGGMGPISGQSTVQGDGINGGSFDANGTADPSKGNLGQISGQGGPAGGNGIQLTRLQATGKIAGIQGTANANGGNAIDTISAYATAFGSIDALVLGGQTGSGIVGCTIKAWSDYTNKRPESQIAAITADVRSALGLGITETTVTSKGDLVSIHSRALNASAISESTFTLSQGDFGNIYGESTNSGNAIQNSSFIADNGAVTSATDLTSVEASGIVAISNGTSVLANGIVGSTFMADTNIGMIRATTRGGTAIEGSTFVADSNFGNPNNGPNLPFSNAAGDGDLGALLGIYAETSGQHLASSAAISGSTFEGELIVKITALVTDREEGGPGISDSTFTARNAVYDGQGNFNNKGTIGAITVVDGSLNGNGIETSEFLAGAGGSIGDINVTTLGGTGIFQSTFSASAFDFDQAEFDSKIGNITVTTGRSTGGQLLSLPPPPNNAWTLVPAGISTSYFAANAGIGNIKVNSIGTGVFFSAFLANFALETGYGFPGLILPLLAPNVPGDIGNIEITSSGRFGAGSVFSVFAGDNIGKIQLQIASRDPNGAPVNLPNLPGPIGAALQFVENLINYTIQNVGPAASAGSLFVATNGNIGGITVKNSGPGSDALLSAFVAIKDTGFLGLGNLGPVDSYASLTAPLKLNLLLGFPSGTPVTTPVKAAAILTPVPKVYKAKETLNFYVTFSGSVSVKGQPTLPVMVGSATRQALYQSGSGSSKLLFSLVVEQGDAGNVTIPAGTAIHTDAANRIAASATGILISQLNPAKIGATKGVSVVTAPPKVLSVSPVTSPSTTSGYKVGELLTVIVTFNQTVLTAGAPWMLLNFGTVKRSLVYQSGSGTNTLRFTYKVTKQDVLTHQVGTTDGLINLPPKATIKDLAGNRAILTGL